MPSKKKKCFLISPIGNEGEDIRERADLVRDYIVVPAAQDYKVERADSIAEPGLITSQILDRLRDDDLVIADLTSLNANVFYELAIRHAANKPVIQIMAEGEKPPFDVANMRTIFFDYQNLKSADNCKKSLIKAIKSIESGGYKNLTPLSYSIDLQALQSDGSTEERVAALVGSLSQEISSLRIDIQRLRSKDRKPDAFAAFAAPQHNHSFTGAATHGHSGTHGRSIGHSTSSALLNTCNACSLTVEAGSAYCSHCGAHQ